MPLFSQLSEWIYAYRDEIIALSWVILSIGLFQSFIYAVQLILAFRGMLKPRLKRSDEDSWWLLTSDITPTVSVLVPAYNEAVTITETVRATLSMHYPSFELIVINDGSADETLEVLKETFNLQPSDRFYEAKLEHQPIKTIYTSESYPGLVVVDKENGGRSDALNAGLDITRSQLFCTLDADSLLDPQGLLKGVQPFIENPDKVVATGGTVRILNGCHVKDSTVTKVALPRNTLATFQTIEYIRAFMMGRLGWSQAGILTLISGAFSIFRRDLATEVGGFDTRTLGEDFELVLKLHKHCLKNKIPYQMHFVPEPVCWTEVPESLKVLRSQRIRWQQGGLEVFFNHISMLLNPRYGRIGMLAMPIIFILDVLSPIAEVLGLILIPLLYATGLLNAEFCLALLAVFFIFGVFISVMSLILEEMGLKRFSGVASLTRLLFYAVLENFGYRQLNNLWRMTGWWRFIRRKQSWGVMTRVGIQNKDAP